MGNLLKSSHTYDGTNRARWHPLRDILLIPLTPLEWNLQRCTRTPLWRTAVLPGKHTKAHSESDGPTRTTSRLPFIDFYISGETRPGFLIELKVSLIKCIMSVGLSDPDPHEAFRYVVVALFTNVLFPILFFHQWKLKTNKQSA